MKKFLSVIISFMMLIGCMILPANAADYPPGCGEIQPLGDYMPSTYDTILLPSESDDFSYSFATATKQYSDFCIATQDNYTGIVMTYRATSASHRLKMRVIRKDTSKVVYSSTISVLNGFEQEFELDFTYLDRGVRYYIELSDPSIAGASGIFTISG